MAALGNDDESRTARRSLCRDLSRSIQGTEDHLGSWRVADCPGAHILGLRSRACVDETWWHALNGEQIEAAPLKQLTGIIWSWWVQSRPVSRASVSHLSDSFLSKPKFKTISSSLQRFVSKFRWSSWFEISQNCFYSIWEKRHTSSKVVYLNEI